MNRSRVPRRAGNQLDGLKGSFPHSLPLLVGVCLNHETFRCAMKWVLIWKVVGMLFPCKGGPLMIGMRMYSAFLSWEVAWLGGSDCPNVSQDCASKDFLERGDPVMKKKY